MEFGGDALAVALGDVSGHGVPAALLMSHLRASFHAEARSGAPTHAVIEGMHASLLHAVSSGRFATFFFVVASRTESVLRFCNAGHNPALLIHDGAIDRLGATGLPLAMMDDARWTEETREFGPGDRLVIYSDGVTECPHHRELYGDERFEALVLRLARRELSAEGMVRAILEDVRAFAHGDLGADDITLVVVKRR
jgi:sigma-B regulation protein RsbU (phosphoserine phosphatase)